MKLIYFFALFYAALGVQALPAWKTFRRWNDDKYDSLDKRGTAVSESENREWLMKRADDEVYSYVRRGKDDKDRDDKDKDDKDKDDKKDKEG
ncbi:hypothetical protein V1519DRAFT_320580 [Lipomyces tetrasporus]